MPHDVFISYSRADWAVAEKVEHALRAAGLVPWRDKRAISPGDSFTAEIAAALDSCYAVVWLASVTSLSAVWVHRELAYAIDGKKHIVPVQLSDGIIGQMPPHLKLLFPHTDHVTLKEDAWDGAIAKVLESLRKAGAKADRVSPGGCVPAAAAVDCTLALPTNLPATGRRGRKQTSDDNPFVWRGGIKEGAAFFDREREQSRLGAFLRNGQNCQIVGPRRIGKTSLLFQVGRVAGGWNPVMAVAYVDGQDPRCATLAGWLKLVAQEFAWREAPTDLAGFAEGAQAMCAAGRRPVLCLDEFEELTRHPGEFAREFFLTLRSCGQAGVSIVTASGRPLSEVMDQSDTDVSPFYNIFSVIRLSPFAEPDAADFLALHRQGVPSFTRREREAIQTFAKGHPLALQVVCFHLLEAKRERANTMDALAAAADEMRAVVSAWPTPSP
jgi:hypothetical protein